MNCGVHTAAALYSCIEGSVVVNCRGHTGAALDSNVDGSVGSELGVEGSVS